MTLGEALKRFRKERNLTQKQIAAELKIFPQVYQTYESDKTVPSVKVLMNLAEKYNVSLDYLTGLSDTFSVKAEKSENDFLQAVIKSSEILQNALKKRGVENVRVFNNQ